MRLDAIAIGNNPPEDVNVIIEVAIGGEPIKYEMDKEAGHAVRRPLPATRRCAIPGITASCRTRCPRTATRSTCWSPTRGRSSRAR